MQVYLGLYWHAFGLRDIYMLAKALIVAIFLGILFTLGSGMIYLIKDRGQSDRTVKALTFRIGISIALFGLLFLLWWAGLIAPHGVRP